MFWAEKRGVLLIEDFLAIHIPKMILQEVMKGGGGRCKQKQNWTATFSMVLVEGMEAPSQYDVD